MSETLRSSQLEIIHAVTGEGEGSLPTGITRFPIIGVWRR
jgi:hypothetical protein